MYKPNFNYQEKPKLKKKETLRPEYIFLIIIFIIAIILIILFSTGVFTQKRYENTTQEELNNISNQMEQLNSPWGTAVPVPGINGNCNVYTFISDYQYSPAIVSYSDIGSCNNGCIGNNCNCSTPITSQGCIDVDQLFAQQVVRSCMGGTELNVQTSGLCRQTNGLLVPPGTIETYFKPCKQSKTDSSETGAIQTTSETNNQYCQGDLSLISFGINTKETGTEIFNNAICLSTPLYIYSDNTISGNISVTNLSPLFQEVCSMNEVYNNIPSQLFRIVRADWDGRKFTVNSNGSFVAIIHRPTGYYVAPTFDLRNNPIIGGDLQIVNVNELKNSGYIWYMTEPLMSPDGLNKSPPQFVYFPDPGLLQYINWNILILQISIQPELMSDGLPSKSTSPKMKNFLTFSTTSNNQIDTVKYNSSIITYLSYSILPLIMKNPNNFF